MCVLFRPEGEKEHTKSQNSCACVSPKSAICTMPDPILDFDYIEFDGERAAAVTRPVIAQTPRALYVGKRELGTIFCSPIGLHQLALGFLLSEGVVGGL